MSMVDYIHNIKRSMVKCTHNIKMSMIDYIPYKNVYDRLYT